MSIGDVMARMATLTDEQLAGLADAASFADRAVDGNDLVLAIAAAASRYLVSHDWDEAWAFVADEFDRYDEFTKDEDS
jgi:hypothetical protein